MKIKRKIDLKYVVSLALIFTLLIFLKPTQVMADMKIYPLDTSPDYVNWFTLTHSIGNDGVGPVDCFDSGPGLGFDKYINEAGNVKTYHPSVTVRWGSSQTPGCQNSNWIEDKDDTGIDSSWIQQKIKIPANIYKITRITFYELIRSRDSNNLQVILIDSAGTSLKSTYKTVDRYKDVDFSNLVNWNVSPGDTYYISLSNSSDHIKNPIVSSYKYFMGSANGTDYWHNDNDVYPDGSADSNNHSFPINNHNLRYSSDGSTIPTADLARLAIWGDGWIPPSCSGTTEFNGCSKVGGSRCSHYGDDSWPNWNLSKWNQCNTACGLTNQNYYCAQCNLSANPISIVAPDSINYSLSVNPAASTAYWNGTKDGATSIQQQISSSHFPAGSTASNFSYSYNAADRGSYTRNVTFKDSNGVIMCTTNPVDISISPPPPNIGTAPISTPPTIQSLVINNPPGYTGFSGLYSPTPVAGAQVFQSGKNWLNPMDITLNVNLNRSTSVRSYIAFYNRTSPFTNGSSFVSNVSSYLRANKNAGLLLSYYTPENRHYLYNPNSNAWVELIDTVNYVPICNGDCTADGSNLLYSVIKGNAGYKWRVKYDTNFGSKTLFTAGYVVDGANASLYDLKSDITPTR